MDKKPLIRKGLVVGIILLFVGVIIAPTINFNTVKASQDDDLVEVTTQACGIKGYGDTTVNLTREQYQNLEEYLVEFGARLNQTTTREEAVPIFKDAVVELDKYGLLPKGMSVERAQRLMTGDYYNKKIDQLLSTIILKLYKSTSGVNYNFLCLVYYRLNSGSNYVLTWLLPVWYFLIYPFPKLFLPILLLKAFFSPFGFMVGAEISGYGFTVHTYGLLGKVDFFIKDDVILFPFTGIRIQYQDSQEPFPAFQRGFLMGFSGCALQFLMKNKIFIVPV